MFHNLINTFFHRVRKNIFPRRKLMFLDPLERGWSLLFWASKIIKIEWLTKKLWCQTYSKAKSSTRIHKVFFFTQVQVFDYFLKEINRNSMETQYRQLKMNSRWKKRDVMNTSWAFCLTVRLTSQLSRQSLDFNDFRCPEK